MNRAMFSGVAGLKAHQTKMDVIGNNIANVNTYGYKTQRAVFSDVYYQTLRAASAGTANRGGTNPSSVGYGSSLTAVQAQMSQSSMINTGFGLDVAITGEGFLQVMDPDGNTFYTKAGMLDYDANGYLTDINGNFVLGSSTADGKPGNQKIKLDNIGSVDPKKPETKVEINGVTYTLSTSNSDKAGNVGLAFGVSKDLPAGLKAQATISSSGAISVKLNAHEKFNSIGDLNVAINAAITEANGGKPHAAGVFTLSADKNIFGTDAASGSFLGKAINEKVKLEPNDAKGLFEGALTFGDFDLQNLPAANEQTSMNLTKSEITGTPPTYKYTLSMTVGGTTYEGEVPANIAKDASIVLKDISSTPASNKSITVKVADKDKLTSKMNLLQNNIPAQAAVTATAPKYLFGGMEITSVSPSFSANGAMKFSYKLDGDKYEITCTVDGKEYKGEVPSVGGGTVQLKVPGGDDALNGFISVKVPSKVDMLKNLGLPATDTIPSFTGGGTPAAKDFLGGATITSLGSAFSASGKPAFTCTYNNTSGDFDITATIGTKVYKGTLTGTAGGPLTLAEVGGAANDTITMSIPSQAAMLASTGAADAAALKTVLESSVAKHNYSVSPFASADAQLQAMLQASMGNHNYTGVAATAGVNTPLTGADIIEGNFGKDPGKIEGFEGKVFDGRMNLIKTSSNFTGSGTVTGNDFKSTYRDTTPPSWEISMTVGGVEYKTSVSEETLASSLLMTSPNGDNIEVSNPGFKELTDYFKRLNPGTDPVAGTSVIPALDGNNTLTVSPATQSNDLGLGTTGFTLTGGTVGGAITLDQLSSIAIGADGTVSVSHADKGTVVAGRISLATFANPSGMQMSGSNYYTASANSGEPNLADPGSSGAGGLKSSSLEMSNVDLSAEFADMITTQRGFQANSRIITVSDTMLEELINLKR